MEQHLWQHTFFDFALWRSMHGLLYIAFGHFGEGEQKLHCDEGCSSILEILQILQILQKLHLKRNVVGTVRRDLGLQ
jgi:hypothetical protein